MNVALDRSDGPSLRSGFLCAVSRFPNATALSVRGATYSYSELDHRARVWAGAILDHLQRRPARIGVFACRSEVGYVGVLSALMAGAAFVPLNPTFPPKKTSDMIERAALDAIIVDKTALPQLPKVLSSISDQLVLLLPEIDAVDLDNINVRVLLRRDLSQAPLTSLPSISVDDVAYLLFTSGSTGEPKGVPISHGNVMHFLDVMRARYEMTPDDRVSQTFDQTFDLSIFDLFMAWHSGACVCAMSPIQLLAPTGFINANKLTVWFSVPSVVAQMRKRHLLKSNSLPSLRLSLFCGEALPIASAEAWQQAAPQSIIENLYGPTELTISCFVHRWSRNDPVVSSAPDVVLIGRPLPGLGAIVVDQTLAPAPAYTPGELCVCGPQTSTGYWRDPSRTSERFVKLPIGGFEERTFYRTGDRVVQLESGEYGFLGRTDHQIKVLGHRVELGEIEVALRKNPVVIDAVAMGWPIESGVAQGIIAFIVGNDCNPEALLEEMGTFLPPYMVPQQIVVLSEMPLNANGKVDRRVLLQRVESLAAPIQK